RGARADRRPLRLRPGVSRDRARRLSPAPDVRSADRFSADGREPPTHGMEEPHVSVWTRTGSAVVGLALAGVISNRLFAVCQSWVGGAALYADWINRVAASVLGAALLLSWFERAPGLRRRLPRPVALALATALAVLSLGVYVAFGDVQF